MGESELQAGHSKKHTKLSENSERFVTENNTMVNRTKRLIQSLKGDDVREGLVAFSHAFQAYSSDFLNFECLEIFVDGLIGKAKQNMTKNIFNVNYFLCVLCGDVLKDPVTLKCGHTFSKKCILPETKAGSFDCLKCGQNYSHSYVSELKIDVVISAVTEKFWKNVHETDTSADKVESAPGYKCDLCTALPEITTNEVDKFLNFDACCSFMENQSVEDFLKKGDALVDLERYEEAVQFYLIYSIFSPNEVKAKSRATKCLHKFLMKCPRLPKSSDCNLPFKTTSDRDNENICCDNIKCWNSVQLTESKEKQDLCLLISKCCQEIEKLTGEKLVKSRIAPPCLEKQEFECPLCMRILWEPITTPCGHTFCRICLYRCFDHKPACPLCKTALTSCLAERVRNINEFIELVLTNIFPDDYAARKAQYNEEMEELYNAGKDPDHVIPLFVCTIAFPTVPCPLHIFEPRYRLMIRQCMESGSRKFGMCAFIDNNIADYGTILEIKDVRYFPDGRSVVDTVGSRRFHILSKGERDGYHTGAVEYLKDDVLTGIFLQDLKELHDYLYKTSQGWFMRLPEDTKHQILQHFGPMPRVESNYLANPDGPSWFWWMLAILPIEPKSQVLILSMTSLARRLRTLERILLHLESTIVS